MEAATKSERRPAGGDALRNEIDDTQSIPNIGPAFKGEPVDLTISLIHADGGTQPRARVNLETVAEYATAMRDGAKFPPVVVFFDGSSYWLADGYHRREATVSNGLDRILAEVKQGTQRDAILYSVGVNSDHGLRRTNADKRRAITRLLEDEEWAQWSDSEIARRCNVSDKTVTSLRPVTSEIRSEKTYTTKHGTTATMDTSNIGKARDPAGIEKSEREKMVKFSRTFNLKIKHDFQKKGNEVVRTILRLADGSKDADRASLLRQAATMVVRATNGKADEVAASLQPGTSP